MCSSDLGHRDDQNGGGDEGGQVAHTALNGRNAFLNLLLIQSWAPQPAIRGDFNGVSWSLSCEALFYLLFPFLMRWVDRIRLERLWAWALAMVAGAWLVPVIAFVLPRNPVIPFAGVTNLELWVIYQSPPAAVLEFVFGMLLARIVVTGRKVPLGRGAAAAVTIGGYAVSHFLPARIDLVATMMLPLGLLVAAAAKADVANRRNWLSGRIMVWLGEVSFAFYLWHALVLEYLYPRLFGPSSNPGISVAEIALIFGVALTLAWLQFTLIERPLMRRFAVSRREKPRESVPEAPERLDRAA